MSMKNTDERYGRVAITVHWLTALLIIGMIGAGITSAMSVDDAIKIAILRIHAPVGMVILALTVFRLLWWMLAGHRPADVAGQTKARALASKWVHRLIYVVLIVMPVSGAVLFRMSAAPDIVFGGAPGPLPEFATYNAFIVHFAGGIVLAGLLALHVGAALYHQFVLKDRLLVRMGLGK